MRTDQAEASARAARTGEGGRKLPGSVTGAEARTVAGGQTKPEALQLMEAAVERNNMLCAYERVVKNHGAPGVDGLTVTEFKPWLQRHWPKIRQALLAGEYIPAAVRKVEIPKPQGGTRTLGIPTVIANCTIGPLTFGMGRDPASFPSALGSALSRTQDTTCSRR